MLASPSRTSKDPLLMSNETFVSCLQFITCFSSTGWGKYGQLYFLENGVTPSHLGIMSSFSTIAKLIGYPTWGIITDLILIDDKINANNNSFKFKIMFISLLILSNLSIWFFYWKWSNIIIFNTFWIMLLLRFIRSWLNSIWNLTDTITIKLINDKSNYGLYRLYASIAWGIGCCISGYLIDIYSMDIMFYYVTILNIFTIILVLIFMPNIPTTKAKVNLMEDDDDNNKSRGKKSLFLLFRILYSMRRDRQFLYSLIIIQIYFITMQIIEKIIYIEMDQQFKMKRINIGIVTMFSVIPEIQLFITQNILYQNLMIIEIN